MDLKRVGEGGFQIDWDLPAKEFEEQIVQITEEYYKEKRVIPLPVELHPGTQFTEMLSLLLPHVDCSRCNAKCCRETSDPEGGDLSILKPEYQFLLHKFGERFIRSKGITMMANGEGAEIPFPCPFLGGDNRCTIYYDRPLVCRIYPFQFGASNLAGPTAALASKCPESAGVALKIYMTAWDIRKQLKFLGKDLPSLAKVIVSNILRGR